MNIEKTIVKLNDSEQMVFVHKEIPQYELTNFKSKIEINLGEFIYSIPLVLNLASKIFYEGGWYYNNPEKFLKYIKNFNLFYIILSPSKMKLRENYLDRTPGSKKKLNQDKDWINYENKIWIPMLKNNKKLKENLRNLNFQFLEFHDEERKDKIEKIKPRIIEQQTPTIFIITGPNASGKSSLFYNLMKEYKLISRTKV